MGGAPKLHSLFDAHCFETENGHSPMTRDESNFRDRRRRSDPARSVEVDGWRAERAWYRQCEGHWLREPSEQLQSSMQARLGVMRAVAANRQDADKVDPLLDRSGRPNSKGVACRGQVVLQERLRPRALEFNDPAEREAWLRKAVEAVRATPKPHSWWPLREVAIGLGARFLSEAAHSPGLLASKWGIGSAAGHRAALCGGGIMWGRPMAPQTTMALATH